MCHLSGKVSECEFRIGHIFILQPIKSLTDLDIKLSINKKMVLQIKHEKIVHN